MILVKDSLAPRKFGISTHCREARLTVTTAMTCITMSTPPPPFLPHRSLKKPSLISIHWEEIRTSEHHKNRILWLSPVGSRLVVPKLKTTTTVDRTRYPPQPPLPPTPPSSNYQPPLLSFIFSCQICVYRSLQLPHHSRKTDRASSRNGLGYPPGARPPDAPGHRPVDDEAQAQEEKLRHCRANATVRQGPQERGLGRGRDDAVGVGEDELRQG